MKASKPAADLCGFFGAVILVLGGLAMLGGSGPALAIFGLSLSLIAFSLNVIGFD